jgi:hypothetical protein
MDTDEYYVYRVCMVVPYTPESKLLQKFLSSITALWRKGDGYIITKFLNTLIVIILLH